MKYKIANEDQERRNKKESKKKTIKEKRAEQRKKTEQRKKIQLRQKLRIKKKKSRKIEAYLHQGSDLLKEKRLKEAYYRFETARNMALDYDDQLKSLSEKKMMEIISLVRNYLRSKLEATIRRIDNLFQAENFDEIRSLTKEFKRKLKQYIWAKINRVFEDFQDGILELWEKIFPKMVEIADRYYDRKQHMQAKELYIQCKETVKKFIFGPERFHLVAAFMKYETLCEVQIIIAEMYELIEQARKLMSSHNNNRAISKLDIVNDLEMKIPIQFRDKRKLDILHVKMNQLREELLHIKV